jgi:hypothetical protein
MAALVVVDAFMAQQARLGTRNLLPKMQVEIEEKKGDDLEIGVGQSDSR